MLQQPSTQPPMQPSQPVQPAAAPWNPAGGAYAAPGQPPAAPYGQAVPYAAPPPPQHAGYGFAYNPGARVTVTWSNGQRYPGTVQQVSGTQCLVVFPDGQHHWVEMQYVAPG